MKQTFEKVESGIYRRTYAKVTGERSVLFYGRLKNKKTSRRELFHLGASLQDARNDFAIIRARNRKGEDISEYKALKPQAESKPSSEVMTFAKWAQLYPLNDEVQKKRSLPTDLILIRLHLVPFFGETPVGGFKRKMLLEYIRSRQAETIIRSGKASKKHSVKRGTISNELSLLHRMLALAAQENEGLVIPVPSFRKLIVRVKRGGRELSPVEQAKVNLVYPTWLKTSWPSSARRPACQRATRSGSRPTWWTSTRASSYRRAGDEDAGDDRRRRRVSGLPADRQVPRDTRRDRSRPKGGGESPSTMRS